MVVKNGACSESESELDFQSYRDAYDSDFEDVRRRVPNLSRLRSTIDHQPQYDLEGIVRELVAVESQKLGSKA